MGVGDIRLVRGVTREQLRVRLDGRRVEPTRKRSCHDIADMVLPKIIEWCSALWPTKTIVRLEWQGNR